jgi:vacuolar-type H+-ATPase subunit H
VVEPKIEKIKAAESAADGLLEQAKELRKEALLADKELRDELLQIADGMEQNAKLMREGLKGMREEIQ